MKKCIMLLSIALMGTISLSAQNDSSRKQKKQKKAKADSTRQHWHGDGKNWPADTIHHMINKQDSLNKY